MQKNIPGINSNGINKFMTLNFLTDRLFKFLRDNLLIFRKRLKDYLNSEILSLRL